jgi:transposase
MDESRLLLTDAAWRRVAAALAALKSRRGAPPGLSDRDFVEAVLYLARTGLPWRDLPARFGNWDAVYNRFRRWLAAGVWAGLLEQLPGAGLEAVTTLYVDSTVVRAHPHAAGAPKKRAASRPRGSAAAGAASPPRSTSRPATSGRSSPRS